MNILAITHLFPHAENTHHGIFAARQLGALKRCGADVTVFFPIVKIPRLLGLYKKKWRNYNQKHAPIPYEGLNVIQMPYFRLTRGFWSCRWEGLALYYAMKDTVLRLHKGKPFDVIYGRGLFPCADAAAHLSRLLKIPAVGACIGGDVNLAPHHSTSLYLHFTKLLTRLDGIVANGQGLAQKITSLTGQECPPSHGFVDLEKFHPVEDKNRLKSELELPLNSYVVLFVGNLKKEKGVYELLEAFAEVREKLPGIILKICGQGIERPGMEKHVQELNISDSVSLVGAVEPADMHKWMQASDLLVLPTYHEGMPNVVMEAMACGLPVISTTVGGLPEALGDSAGAVLIEPKNTGQLADAIETLAVNKELCKKMAVEARQTAEKKFGDVANSKKLLTCLEAAIERYKKRSQ